MITFHPLNYPKYEMVRDDVKQKMPEETAWVDFVTFTALLYFYRFAFRLFSQTFCEAAVLKLVKVCPTYSMIRNKFYYKVKTLIPNITQLPINGLINKLMNSSNYFINIQFIKYIFQLVLMFVTN